MADKLPFSALSQPAEWRADCHDCTWIWPQKRDATGQTFKSTVAARRNAAARMHVSTTGHTVDCTKRFTVSPSKVTRGR